MDWARRRLVHLKDSEHRIELREISDLIFLVGNGIELA
jgi:hypothetical protein